MNLYIADTPPTGDISEWDTNLDRTQIIEKVNQAILGYGLAQAEPGEQLIIIIEPTTNNQE